MLMDPPEREMITRPMLAEVIAPNQLDQLRFPVLASRKYDGIRCLLHPEFGAVSRSFKDIPNHVIRTNLNSLSVDCLDGEILIFIIDEGQRVYLPYNPIQSIVMSGDFSLPLNHEIEYVVFDDFTYPNDPYITRQQKMLNKITDLHTEGNTYVRPVIQHLCHNPKEVTAFYSQELEEGHEGIMIRGLDSPYKSGRGTLREQFMLKMKPVHQDEGIITDAVPLESNENLAQQDIFGLTKRSSAKAGKVQKELLGAFLVDTTQWGVVRLGSGFTAAQRAKYWKDRESLKGRKVRFKYQAIGIQDKPRFPRFVKLLPKG